MKKNPKRDTIIILIILAIAISGYLLFNSYLKSNKATQAHVIYDRDVLVVVDFEKKVVDRKKKQPNIEAEYLEDYPIINFEEMTITLLGDFKKDNIRQEVVIEYDFEKHSMQIIEEESPNNICSNLGESTLNPLICIPNNIRITFVKDKDIDIDGSI